MLSTASNAAAGSRSGIRVDVTSAGGGPSAPSAALEAALRSQRIGWRQFERAYVDEMRALYRRDKSLFVDLVEQAMVMDVVLVGEFGDDEETVWCARRLLKEILLDVAWDRGLPLAPDMEDIDLPQLAARRKAVLAAEGLPLECPVCHRSADTALALVDEPGRGYCSRACLEKAAAIWKAANERKLYGSGRRP
jgi:hypothetical protein